MSLVINSNISSLNAQRQLVKSGAEMNQAMERLSSGKRINTAADDAAGLAITNRQTAQIKGLDRAVANANDGISLIQTAEGALDETTNILQRMRELSVQSANGIYDDADRATINAESEQLKAEMNRIAQTTSFNGKNLLDGSMGKMSLQVGAQSNQTIDISVGSFNTSSLGGMSGDLVGEASDGLTALSAFAAEDADDTLYINGVALSSLADGTLNDKLASINADLDGRGAKASTLVSVEATGVGSGVLLASDTLTLSVVDGNGKTQSFQITGTNSMEELVSKINSDTSISASLSDKGKLVLSQEGATSITTTAAGNAEKATGLPAAATTTNFSLVLTDTSADGRGVTVWGAADGGVASDDLMTAAAALGVDVQDKHGNIQGATISSATPAALKEGDLIINGVAVGAVTAGADAEEQAANLIEAINKISNQTGVVAIAGAADDSIALASTRGEVSIKYGDNAAGTIAGDTGLQERNAAAGTGSIASVDLSTQAGAQRAIDVIDTALEQVNAQRADLGAISNRLDFTVSNLMNVSENTSAARSRIQDADFAAETANLSRAQVLQQASQAMLAQANAAPQQVLSLLR
jgi:flagellin